MKKEIENIRGNKAVKDCSCIYQKKNYKSIFFINESEWKEQDSHEIIFKFIDNENKNNENKVVWLIHTNKTTNDVENLKSKRKLDEVFGYTMGSFSSTEISMKAVIESLAKDDENMSLTEINNSLNNKIKSTLSEKPILVKIHAYEGNLENRKTYEPNWAELKKIFI